MASFHTIEILGKETIHVGHDLLPHIVTELFANLASSTYALITDTNLAPLYLSRFQNAFNKARLQSGRSDSRLLTYTIAPGESSKTRETKAEIEDWLLASECVRDTVVIAMGGGVIGDMIGYVAATFMRGVRFIQLPTTLLAMVDSSIGGKTAVDTPLGKNLIGSFWQPERVYIDLSFLETLPEREFINGMAEVIKTAAIWDETAFIHLEDNCEIILRAIRTKADSQGAPSRLASIGHILRDIVAASVRVKAYVVSSDERESGLRNLLNYGHSIGHAIEAIMTPQMLHGECVSIGMVKEAELARSLGVLAPEAMARVIKCLRAYNLPTSMSEPRVQLLSQSKQLHTAALLKYMAVDKKNDGKTKKIVLLSGIGRTHEKKATAVSDESLRKILSHHILIQPTNWDSSVHVTITPPGSKSISNRVLLIAALGDGTCRLKNLLHSDDTHLMLKAIQQLQGASFTWEANGEILVVDGGSGHLMSTDEELYLGNSGTASRFLTTLCTLLSGDGMSTVITGNDRMKQRPIGPLVDALRGAGSEIQYLESPGSLPLRIKAGIGLQGGDICLSATVSSQYVSSVLMSAPYALAPVTLKLIGGRPISQSYIDMTISIMKTFGIEVTRSTIDPNTYHIPVGRYRNPPEYVIESDASSATYPLAIAAITGIKCTIPNIGSSSLQGDAEFATSVLETMGCTVIQTTTSTTVQGPPRGTLRPLPHIDMESMTDAFLSAAVLAAVANGTNNVSEIHGIANQRVKECDRIAAMITELRKFGVEASELADGICIQGLAPQALSSPKNGVFCYDDHRVAMSFSVLSCALSKPVLILDKSCVEKTWPNWWDILHNEFSVPLIGADNDVEQPVTDSLVNLESRSSIILIGMRGAGKTTIGTLVATLMDMEFVDFDTTLEQSFDMEIPDIVRKYGWETFRERELQILMHFLQHNPTGYIASCGGGIVDIPAAREILQNYIRQGGLVLHIHRKLEDIVTYLEIDKTRPAYAIPTLETWSRRKQWFADCSTYQYYSPVTLDTSAPIRVGLSRFFQSIQGRSTDEILLKPNSFFLSLTSPDIRQVKNMDHVTVGSDSVELRVDLLRGPGQTLQYPSLEYVSEQFACLRQTTSLPIIFTVRTRGQGGNFPVSEESIAKTLMMNAIKWGVEFLDVELTWSPQTIHELSSAKRNTKIIGSWHDVEGAMQWNSDAWFQKVEAAEKFADIIKLVGVAKSMHDNIDLEQFRVSYQKISRTPIIAINMGTQGQLSRVLNPFMTPVTHSGLPIKAAPGQLSIFQINQCSYLAGLIIPRKFYLLGSPIAHSRSPALHNACFWELALPHTYLLHETADVHRATAVLNTEDFGGASVTIPYKESIVPFLDELSEEAKTIGAVNTIIPISQEGKRILRGDNTDWIGIQESLMQSLGGITIKGPAFIIGSGGTARAAVYASHRMGLSPIYIVNRSSKSLNVMIAAFQGILTLQPIQTLEEARSIQVAPVVAISTVPGNVTLPPELSSIISYILSLQTTSLIRSSRQFLEMAYLPRITPLMDIAEKEGWTTIQGIEPLVKQGLQQFFFWTGFRINSTFGRAAVLGEQHRLSHANGSV